VRSAAMIDRVTRAGARSTLILFVIAGALCLAAVGLTAATPGEGANIGAGGLILLAMLTGLVATVRTVQQRQIARVDPRTGLGRRTLTGIASGSAVAAVLAAAVGQWPLAVAAVVPAVVCAIYALRGSPA
jgi:predicted signal transduction protein with EAL and GGDEF domain